MAWKNSYYIVAANANEYRNWLSSDRPRQIIPEINAGQFYEIRYVSSVDILRGLSEIKGFYLPGCKNHPEYKQIKNIIDCIKITSQIKTVPANNTGAISGNISAVWLDEFGNE